LPRSARPLSVYVRDRRCDVAALSARPRFTQSAAIPKPRAAGIRVERITLGVYVLAGVLAALGGLAITGYVGAISANQGNGLILTVFAAAVIGGSSLDGGKGTIFGALTGVLLLGVVGNLLTLAQVPSFWIQAIYGVIILGSLMVARFAGEQSQE
jgi:simple sugar transport system permease protein